MTDHDDQQGRQESQLASEPASVAHTSTIEWLELFFDLVVVAAIAVLTEGLREGLADPHTQWVNLGLFVVLYVAIWFGWVSTVLYANVAGQTTRTRTVVLAMLAIAVMAVTAPIHDGDRANAFAIAFLLLRSLTARASLNTHRLLASWPILQFGGASVPWIVSLWVDPPWKYVLWAIGIGLDLGLVLLQRHGSASQLMQRAEQLVARDRDQRDRAERREQARDHPRRRRTPDPAADVPLSVVPVDAEHLQERLGLFVIIVLGEVVSQLVLAIAGRDAWSWPLLGPAIAAFGVLVGLWWLTFAYGFVGAPHTRLALMEPRFGLPMHLLSTIGIVAMAAGFGEMTSHPDEPLAGLARWVMAAGLTVHFAVMGVAGLSGGAPRRWLLGWVLPCGLAPLGIAAIGELGNGWTVLAFGACIGWMAAYGRVAGHTRADDRDAARPPTISTSTEE